MYNKDMVYKNQLKLLDPKNKDRFILLRNSQMIRNLFFDVITTLTTSLKTKKYDKYSKINITEDFKYENMKKRLCGGMNILPDSIMRFNDPDEIKIILNEIFTMSKNKQFGYDRCCFWILWLLKWEGQHKKKKVQWNVEYRDVKEVDKKFRSNVIWIIWDIINEELKSRDENVREQISYLYKLYTNDYTLGKRNTRLPLLFHAFGYLTHDINFSVPLRASFTILSKSPIVLIFFFLCCASHRSNHWIQKQHLSYPNCLFLHIVNISFIMIRMSSASLNRII